MNIGELAKFRGGIATDTISELTSASGVTIDSMLIKDGKTSVSNIETNASGVAPAAGVLGETISSACSGVSTTALSGGSTGATATIASVDITAGVWLICANAIAYINTVPSTSGKVAGGGSDLYDGSSIIIDGSYAFSFSSATADADGKYANLTHCLTYVATGAKTITFRLRCDKISGDEANGAVVTSTTSGKLQAVRIG